MLRMELDPRLDDPKLKDLWQRAALVTRQIQAPPVCRVVKSGTQDLLAGAITLLTFPTTSSTGVAWDSHNAWDTSNSRYLPKETGYYRFTAKARFTAISAAPNAVGLSVRVNGSNYSVDEDYVQNTAHTVILTVSDQVYLNGTTDYIDVTAISVSATATIDNDSFYTSLSIEYIGADQIR
jgi:hypothetical protein